MFTLRAHDCDRNGRLPLHTIANYSMNYRMQCGIFDNAFVPFLKAQHLVYRSEPPFLRRNVKPPTIESMDYCMDYGNSSFWQISHYKTESHKNIFADNIVLIVGTNLETRRPTSVNKQCKDLCDQNKTTYPRIHSMDYYALLKSRLSSNIQRLD